MSRPTGASKARARLSPEAQRVLQHAIATRGDNGAAEELGLTVSVVFKLADGGGALPATVARAEALIKAYVARRST